MALRSLQSALASLEQARECALTGDGDGLAVFLDLAREDMTDALDVMPRGTYQLEALALFGTLDQLTSDAERACNVIA